MSSIFIGEDKLRTWAASLAKTGVDGAEQTEVSIASNRWALTRFANSVIHQNMASENLSVHVRAVCGKRVAAASTNLTDEADIQDFMASVAEMLRLQEPNPDFVSLPGPDRPASDVCPWSPSTADSTPEDRARSVERLLKEAAGVGATAAGTFTTNATERAVANSLGISNYCRGTYAQVRTVVTGPDGGFGHGAAIAQDVNDIDAGAVGAEASAIARDSRSPQDLEPGDYECILMPYAVHDIVTSLRWMGFYALAYQEGRSFLCGKLGTKLVDERINIWDDGLDARTLVNPFDSEGVPKQHVDLFKDGVATGLLYDSYTAHREGKKSTGHASGMNLVMAPGDATVEEMIASTKRGLLVSRFHYTNVSHLMSASVTGMTRDGTFLIENGKIAHPVKNLRFTQSYLAALSNLDMLGKDLKLVGGSAVPAIKVSKFHFSSATQF